MAAEPRHVHFVAICGTGMGSLAGLLAARGLRVTGSDEGLYPPMSELLARWKIPVAERFAAANVLTDRPDLVVIGNAVRSDNPEARAVIDAGIPYRSFPDALFELAMKDKHPVVVAGTHGKTTTTSLVAALLLRCGRDPSVLVGGHSADLDGSFREGKGPHFVVEGDEYDTAFFDKTPKFLHYGARTLLLTSIEFDHADIYFDLAHVKRAFAQLVRSLPADGRIVAALNDANVRDVVREAPCPVIGYGLSEEGAPGWRAEALRASADGMRFRLLRPGCAALDARLPLHGRFNVENALGALATLDALGVAPEQSVPALASFQGVRRRQEVRGEARGVLVLDDFAHHPTAVRLTLEAVRERFPGRRLVAVFEPRSNTSRRAVFQKNYAAALAAADRVVIETPPEGPLYSATGEVAERFSSAALAADLAAAGVEAEALRGVDAIVARLVETCRPGDVVLIMSNGGFGGIWERLLDALRAG